MILCFHSKSVQELAEHKISPQLLPLVPPYRSQVFSPHISCQPTQQSFNTNPSALYSRPNCYSAVDMSRTQTVNYRPHEYTEDYPLSTPVFNLPNTVHDDNDSLETPIPAVYVMSTRMQ